MVLIDVPDTFSRDYFWDDYRDEVEIIKMLETNYSGQVVRIHSFGRKYFDGTVVKSQVFGS